MTQSNNPSNPDRDMNCAVKDVHTYANLSETKKRAIDAFLLRLIEQFSAQEIAEALGVDTQVVIDYYTQRCGRNLPKNEK